MVSLLRCQNLLSAGARVRLGFAVELSHYGRKSSRLRFQMYGTRHNTAFD
jgi:hypothetical protein